MGIKPKKPYPLLIIDIDRIRYNTEALTHLCQRQGIEVTGIVKGVCGLHEVAEAMLAGGVTMLGDSRLENIKKLSSFPVSRLLVRLPMLSQAADAVAYADLSLNSEIKTIEALGQAAKQQGKIHGIILMAELGDRREGIPLPRLIDVCAQVLSMEGVRLVGLGTNLTCFGGVIPDPANLGALAAEAERIQAKLGVKLDIISGGNSSSVHLLEKGLMPSGINNLRLGECILTGVETAYDLPVTGTRQDAFTLWAEIIEVQEKPSLPEGEIGHDSFGRKPAFIDRGMRKRAILALGRQDVYPEYLKPLDQGVVILGASGDHFITDISDSATLYAVGDRLSFRPNYAAIMQLATSPYVSKELVSKWLYRHI